MKGDILKKLSRENMTFFFDKDIPPAMTVTPGEIFAVETEDAIAGQLTPATVNRMTHAEMKANVPCSNPVTGPIAVTGAEPGDCLEVEILDIQVADYAWTIFDGTGGLLTNLTTLNTPLPEQKKILPIQENHLLFNFGKKQIQVPVQPAVGTIGLAPRHERHYAFLNGNDYLGNVDIPALGVGKTLRLPVHVPGALLSLGDIHAVSGQGEISSGAADCRGTVQLRVTVRKAGELPYFHLPQLDSDGFIGVLATGGSIADTLKQAYRDLVLRMQHEHNFAPVDAYQLLSSVGQLQLGQLLPPQLNTALAYISRDFLGE